MATTTMATLAAPAALLALLLVWLVSLLSVSVVALPLQGSARLGSRVSNHSKVIIIGAGAAGHAAAARLMENGFYDLTILEAEGRTGGRIHSVRFAENMVELGAEWVHGEVGNVVYEMAEPLGLLGHGNKNDLYSNMAFVWSGGAVADHHEIGQLLNASNEIRSAGVTEGLHSFSGSYGEWFLDQFNQRLMTMDRRPPADVVDRFLAWYDKKTGFYDGSDTWFNTSGRGLTHYKECPGDLWLAWKRNGYRSVFDLLTKRYPNRAQELPVRRRVLLNSEVSAIRWAERVNGTATPSPSPWQGHNEVTEAPDDAEGQGSQGPPAATMPPVVVELSNGGRHTADMVVVTVSLGVLKHSAVELFDPPLPHRKMNAVRNLGFGQVNKLFMYFSVPWWPSALSGYSVLVTEEDLEAFKRKYPQYGANGHWVHGLTGFYIDQHKPNVVLMDWIVGEPARIMERYSDYQIMMGCKRWLDMFLGRNYSIPLPVGFTRSKWWSNPHFRGSYSYRSLDSDRADAWAGDLAQPLLDSRGLPAVMFAGEATHDHFYSTVHGAIETGWREADRILNALKLEGRLRTSSNQDGQNLG